MPQCSSKGLETTKKTESGEITRQSSNTREGNLFTNVRWENLGNLGEPPGNKQTDNIGGGSAPKQIEGTGGNSSVINEAYAQAGYNSDVSSRDLTQSYTNELGQQQTNLEAVSSELAFSFVKQTYLSRKVITLPELTQDSSAWSQINPSEATFPQSGDESGSWMEGENDPSRDEIPQTNHSTGGEQAIRNWAQDVHQPNIWDIRASPFDPSMRDRVMIDQDGNMHPSTYKRIFDNAQTTNLSEVLASSRSKPLVSPPGPTETGYTPQSLTEQSHFQAFSSELSDLSSMFEAHSDSYEQSVEGETQPLKRKSGSDFPGRSHLKKKSIGSEFELLSLSDKQSSSTDNHNLLKEFHISNVPSGPDTNLTSHNDSLPSFSETSFSSDPFSRDAIQQEQIRLSAERVLFHSGPFSELLSEFPPPSDLSGSFHHETTEIHAASTETMKKVTAFFEKLKNNDPFRSGRTTRAGIRREASLNTIQTAKDTLLESAREVKTLLSKIVQPGTALLENHLQKLHQQRDTLVAIREKVFALQIDTKQYIDSFRLYTTRRAQSRQQEISSQNSGTEQVVNLEQEHSAKSSSADVSQQTQRRQNDFLTQNTWWQDLDKVKQELLSHIRQQIDRIDSALALARQKREVSSSTPLSGRFMHENPALMESNTAPHLRLIDSIYQESIQQQIHGIDSALARTEKKLQRTQKNDTSTLDPIRRTHERAHLSDSFQNLSSSSDSWGQASLDKHSRQVPMDISHESAALEKESVVTGFEHGNKGRAAETRYKELRRRKESVVTGFEHGNKGRAAETRYKELRRREEDFKKATGLASEEFDQLEPTLEWHYKDYLRSTGQRDTFGKSQIPLPRHRLLFILDSLNAERSHTKQGSLFGVSSATSSEWFRILSTILRKTVDSIKDMPSHPLLKSAQQLDTLLSVQESKKVASGSTSKWLAIGARDTDSHDP